MTAPFVTFTIDLTDRTSTDPWILVRKIILYDDESKTGLLYYSPGIMKRDPQYQYFSVITS